MTVPVYRKRTANSKIKFLKTALTFIHPFKFNAHIKRLCYTLHLFHLSTSTAERVVLSKEKKVGLITTWQKVLNCFFLGLSFVIHKDQLHSLIHEFPASAVHSCEPSSWVDKLLSPPRLWLFQSKATFLSCFPIIPEVLVITSPWPSRAREREAMCATVFIYLDDKSLIYYLISFLRY